MSNEFEQVAAYFQKRSKMDAGEKLREAERALVRSTEKLVRISNMIDETVAHVNAGREKPNEFVCKRLESIHDHIASGESSELLSILLRRVSDKPAPKFVPKNCRGLIKL